MLKHKITLWSLLVASITLNAQNTIKVFPGADEKTPAKSQYFSWINNTNEGSTEENTLINFSFFKWLKDEYGMQLDIYAFDAGAIDGKRFYGSMDSDRFKKQFPNGFEPIHKEAKDIGFTLGLWGGPDGFGDTPKEEKARTDMMVKLVRDYDFNLFKFDRVCGQLRPDKEDAFVNMMIEARMHRPDLILLNHRLALTEKGLPHATTFLWEGVETYVDGHIKNDRTATHHRVGNLLRGYTPDMKRLTEDHGVCLSSCLDYWEDDLILQAFHRNLILAPEIYGNPWLLRDEEFPRLARIFNLHKQYRDILVEGIKLPESQYGMHAISRGDKNTRLLVLKNLSWEPVTYQIDLNKSIGLEASNSKVQVKQYHPFESVIGNFNYNNKASITVLPFRSCLIKVSNTEKQDLSLEGVNYEVVKNIEGEPVEIDVLGYQGTTASFKLNDFKNYKLATIDGKNASKLVKGKSLKVTFDGEKINEFWHRKLTDLKPVDFPNDAENLYEATCFATDNNAFEVRSLFRSGETNIPQVKAARDAFFNQQVFVDRGVWDKNLFDDDYNTSFYVGKHRDKVVKIKEAAFRLDFGEPIFIDELKITSPDDYSFMPKKPEEAIIAEVSSDLKTWKPIIFMGNLNMTIEMPKDKKIRYVRIADFADRLSEVQGFYNGKKLNSTKWKASNLLGAYQEMEFDKAFSATFTLNDAHKNSYLAVALNGYHGEEGAYAALRVDGKIIGAPDRSISYPVNSWEAAVCDECVFDKNFTYYFPITKDLIGKQIEVVVLGTTACDANLKSDVWITSYPIPFQKKRLILK
ncbi:hypothetical protein [Flavivirga spongiicola]|uniref:Uncharacterized protein n=1 Tax=Flavivirga spongiicola TaxID=421621 RepID=A0ABU7XPQ5_9FLAO|nr:hypothetical protein [Flavivirga sp. MEBiC05379]MDO5977428.1 hypothetical protein [Flavivirga sp. MEBiC05379]